ncbi:PilZ domain-containing protein [Novosphingobium sp.]|uniref:PilZ domain-containing protein n=1 Tax=Novosphingobium sp. TaxID=1874826 RepID=UPI0035ADDECC
MTRKAPPADPAPAADDAAVRDAADQRAAQRYTLLLRAGKLVSDAGEYLCILRDASSTGIKARLFHELPAAPRFELELGNGDRYAVEPVWQSEGHAGFRFAEGPVDVHELMDEGTPFPKRSIRLRLVLPVMVTDDAGLSRAGQLQDLSQQGALLVMEPGLALGQQVRIAAPGLPERHARVRWRRRTAHGLVFQEAFRLDELAVLAHRLQTGAVRVPAGQTPSRVNQ